MKILEERGSVAMEYALGAFLIAIPIFLFWFCVFNPAEGYSSNISLDFMGIEFKMVGGKAWAESFQRILSGIALPLP